MESSEKHCRLDEFFGFFFAKAHCRFLHCFFSMFRFFFDDCKLPDAGLRPSLGRVLSMDDQYLINRKLVGGIDLIDQHIFPHEIISILEFSFHAPNMAES